MHLMGFFGGKSIENSWVEILDLGAWSFPVSGGISKRSLSGGF